MKTSVIILFSIIFNTYVFSQKGFEDQLEYKATYQLTAKLDSTDSDFVKSEEMLLFIGNEVSTFSSKGMNLENSLKISGNTGSTSKAALTEFHYIIVKDAKNKKMYYTHKIVDDNFFYSQELNPFNWAILEETKAILNYECQKAVTSFAGRKYFAWFTTEIPISEGPYKFNGLPGLIVEIYDTEEDYTFKLIGFEKLEPKILLKLKLKNYIEIDKSKLLDLWHEYKRDPFMYVNNPNVTISPEIHKKYQMTFKKMLEQRNNPLELK
tara:strand:+ start:3256 stop:4053 length:798 start_codon:yes stop_codon:yes gene_type:complete